MAGAMAAAAVGPGPGMAGMARLMARLVARLPLLSPPTVAGFGGQDEGEGDGGPRGPTPRQRILAALCAPLSAWGL